MVPLAPVDEVVDCRPTCCEDGGALLLPLLVHNSAVGAEPAPPLEVIGQ